MMEKLSARFPSACGGETPAGSSNTNMADFVAKITKLEEAILKSEKVALTRVDMDKLCLFPNATLP